MFQEVSQGKESLYLGISDSNSPWFPEHEVIRSTMTVSTDGIALVNHILPTNILASFPDSLLVLIYTSGRREELCECHAQEHNNFSHS